MLHDALNVLTISEVQEEHRRCKLCEERVLRYFGHVARRDGENLEEAIITGKVPTG